MITNKKQQNLTIDLKGMKAKEYLDSKKTDMELFKEKVQKYINISAVIWLVVCSVFILSTLQAKEVEASDTTQEMSIKDKIRKERLYICEKAYKKSEINEQFIYGQVPAVRCATFMTLVYAMESTYGKSIKCVNTKNCLGMKGNGVNHPAGFIKFKTETESREWFANRYWKFHYKKKINTFVRNWSETDQEAYIHFVESNYWKTYMELEQLYFTNK